MIEMVTMMMNWFAVGAAQTFFSGTGASSTFSPDHPNPSNISHSISVHKREPVRKDPEALTWTRAQWGQPQLARVHVQDSMTHLVYEADGAAHIR